MRRAFIVTHPDVVINPLVPVPDWRLSERGLARMAEAARRPWSRAVGAVFSSAERKAREAAAVLAAARGVEVAVVAALGENDRSATGYLPRAAFEAMADAFFARPCESVGGWERAKDAQRRMLGAFEDVLTRAPPRGDLAIVTHGAVAALLLCALEGRAITRDADQPAGQGGWFYSVDPVTRGVCHGWTAIDG